MKTKIEFPVLIAALLISVLVSWLVISCGNLWIRELTDPLVEKEVNPGDFVITGLSQIYDGNPKTVSITPKPGKSNGAVTIYYNGSTTAPGEIGSYAVTFDVAKVKQRNNNWKAASGLSAGTLEISRQTANPQNPTANDFEFDNLTQTAGSVTAVTISPKEGKSKGLITIYYNGSTVIPQTAGNYTVTFDVSAAEGWNAASGLEAGTLIIADESLTASTDTEFTTALSTVQSDSTSTNFVIDINSDLSLGPQDLSLDAYKGKTVIIRGKSAAHKINLSSTGSIFTVGENVELILEDITLQGRSDNNAPLIKVNKGGKLNVRNGGKITGNTYTTSTTKTGGGGIVVDGGTLEITGGEISGNTVNGTVEYALGGGVCAINGSTVLMTGGAIRNNSVINNHSSDGNAMGGGIVLYSDCKFDMTGGIIEGNVLNDKSVNLGSFTSGGGVLMVTFSSSDIASIFRLSGGIIRNNKCQAQSYNNYGISGGGGVDVNQNIFIMSGGVISGNSVTSSINPNKYYRPNNVYSDGAYGGGVRVYDLGTFVKTGGIIYGSDAAGNDADGIPLKNMAQSDSSGLGGGHAVFFDNGTGIEDSSTFPRRNTTAYTTDNMDNSVSGSAGGWE